MRTLVQESALDSTRARTALRLALLSDDFSLIEVLLATEVRAIHPERCGIARSCGMLRQAAGSTPGSEGTITRRALPPDPVSFRPVYMCSLATITRLRTLHHVLLTPEPLALRARGCARVSAAQRAPPLSPARPSAPAPPARLSARQAPLPPLRRWVAAHGSESRTLR